MTREADAPPPGIMRRSVTLSPDRIVVSRRRDAWLVVGLYAALTFVLAYPLTRHPASRVLADGPDTRLFIWTLAWDTHAFTTHPLSIFDANIYYPERNTLAYSENLIGASVLAAPILWLTKNPVLAMNVVALSSTVLCGLGAYILGRRLGLGRSASVLGGIVFAFSPPRFFRISQLHLTTIHWMPFALAWFHKYFDEGRARDLRLALAFFTAQALTSGHGAVFLGVAMMGLALYRIACGEPLLLRTRLQDLGAAGVLLLLPAALIFLVPYRAVQLDMGLRRAPDEFVSDWASFLASPAHAQSFLLSFFSSARINETAQAYLFPGYIPLGLIVAAFWTWRSKPVVALEERRSSVWQWVALLLEMAIVVSFAVALLVSSVGPIHLRLGSFVVFSARRALRVWLFFVACIAVRMLVARHLTLDISARLRRRVPAVRAAFAAHRGDALAFYGLLTAFSVWLSLGALGGLWPRVYWLPGLNFIRVPARFSLLAMLGVAMLAAMGWERVSASFESRTRVVLATILGGLLVAEFSAMPLGTVPYRVEIPAVDRWLDSQPKPFAVAELPLANPRNLGAWERRHTEYMLHSMAHWQKTVEGYSGLRPPLHEALYLELTNFPDEKSLRHLTELGVGYVVVHKDLYPPRQWLDVDLRLREFQASLVLRHEDGEGRVYSLRSVSVPPGRR